MSNFTIGDKIVVTDNFVFDEVKFKVGQTGTIVDINIDDDRYEGGTLSIQWDFSNGSFHSCNGHCPARTGYNVTANRAKIMLAQPSTGNPLPADPRLRGIALKILQMETRFKRRQEAKNLNGIADLVQELRHDF